MRHKIHIHTGLLAVYPVLSFWLLNKDFFLLQSAARSLVFCTGAALLLQIIFARLLKSPGRGALLASLVTVAVLYFGQVYYSFHVRLPFRYVPEIFFVLWFTLIMLGMYWVLRSQSGHPRLNNYLNLTSALLLMIPLFRTIQTVNHYPTPRHPTTASVANDTPRQQVESDLPDIYYIVLDTYGRGDVLANLYGLDNSNFLYALQTRGFYVAEQSQSNYIQTHLSLSSSLDGNYLDPAQFDPDWTSRVIAHSYLEETPNLEYLHRLGYEMVSTQDADQVFNLDITDRFLAVDHSFSIFELGFNRATLNILWTADLHQYRDWKRIRAQLDALAGIPLADGPARFVFAHILSPHPPFDFDAAGNFTPTLMDHSGNLNVTAENRADYISGYRTQIQYLNQRVLEIVDHIQGNPDRPAIIMLQGDHGPAAYLDWESPVTTCLQERLSILNAYYFPDAATKARLYPGISPINSMRLVLSEVTGTSIPLLEDRSYYSTWGRPYDFQDVTSSADTCSPLEH